MGTRSAPRSKAKAKRIHRLQRSQQHPNKSLEMPSPEVATGGEFACETATLCLNSSFTHSPLADASSPAAHCQASPASCQSKNPGGETSTIKQVAAAALILGQNVTKTAEALGIDRRTVQRWHKLDPEFQDALRDTKQEAVLSSRQTLLALAESAVGMVETKLSQEQNPRVALALLRGLGVLAPPKVPVPSDEAATNKKEFCDQTATLAASHFNSPPDREHDPVELQAADFFEEVADRADLSPAQQMALDVLYAGKSLLETAAIVGTPVEQVRSWLTHDWRFSTLLSGLQFERVCTLRYRLLYLIDQAVELVRHGIHSGDSRLALALLRGLGLMS